MSYFIIYIYILLVTINGQVANPTLKQEICPFLLEPKPIWIVIYYD
jgi:hypothetical protein